MAIKKLNIDKIINSASFTFEKWELDNIIWADRNSNPVTLMFFLSRIKELKNLESITILEKRELANLEELANQLDESECVELLNISEDQSRQLFLENLARQSAIEVITNQHTSFSTMETMCKLQPSDFILAAKRTQDLINAIHELVIQGETLSKDVAGA